MTLSWTEPAWLPALRSRSIPEADSVQRWSTGSVWLPGRGERARTAACLIHGFTGSPAEFRWMANYLHGLGFSVLAVLLPGHGTDPADMLITDETDWLQGVLDGCMALQSAGVEQIIPVGFSMGALLALQLTQAGLDVDIPGVVCLAAPLDLGNRGAAKLARWMQYVVKYVRKKRPREWSWLEMEAGGYPVMPVPAVVRLLRLVRQVEKTIHQVRVPLFVGHGSMDRTALPGGSLRLYRDAASRHKELQLYPDRSHNLLLEDGRERVFADVAGFMERIARRERR